MARTSLIKKVATLLTTALLLTALSGVIGAEELRTPNAVSATDDDGDPDDPKSLASLNRRFVPPSGSWRVLAGLLLGASLGFALYGRSKGR